MSWKQIDSFIDVKQIPWASSHASSMSLEKMHGHIGSFLVTARDSKNRSRIGRLDFNFETLKIEKVSHKPVLSLGAVGQFDESGTSYPCVYGQYLYYTGWTKGVTVPFYNMLGLAKINSLGEYERVSRQPLRIESDQSTIGIGSVDVIRYDSKDLMFYTSFLSWNLESEFKHQYTIKIAESSNGVVWHGSGNPLFSFAPDENCIAKPALLKEGSKLHMWYSAKVGAKEYRIKHAISLNAFAWTKDGKLDLNHPTASFDSHSRSYPCLTQYKDKLYMFYAGNDYGRDGMGLASISMEELL